MSAKTLRELGGPPAGLALPGGRTALLLIDYQNEYLGGALPLAGAIEAVAEAVRLRDAARRFGWAVIHVHHHTRPGAAIFAPGSAGAAPIASLLPGDGEAVVVKHLPSSFAGTELAALLEQGGIDTLLLAGFMTHNCVDSTAREAFHRGFRVQVAAGACATRDLPLPGDPSAVLPAAAVQAGVLAGLNDRIAEVVGSAALLGMG